MTGFVECLLLRLISLDWNVSDFSALSRGQKTMVVNIPYRGSHGPSYLLVDCNGINAEGKWSDRKHGCAKRSLWRKINFGINEQILKTRPIEVTGSHVGDAPVLPELLAPSRLRRLRELGLNTVSST